METLTMDSTNRDANFADLPAAFLRSVAEALWEDGKDLAHLIATCKGVRAVCDETNIWKKLVVRRFGDSVIPGTRPTAGEYAPEQLEGWVFYQGRDASEESDQRHSEAASSTALQQLAHLAQGADAFTTTGKVINVLQKPQDAWTHFSFHPRQGMYIKADVVEQKGLQQPQQSEGSEWPPQVPGWQYFPSCVSEGYTRAGGEAKDSLARYRQLKDLLEASQDNPQIVAVTSQGDMKTKLRPQSCWAVNPSYDVGLYVKHVAGQMQLVMPPPVPDYRALYAKLDKLRLDAGHMWATWLNDQYLQLVQDAGSPADSNMLMRLNSVWWLDVGGSIAGVPPGSYEVCWIMDVTNVNYYNGHDFNLSAEAHAAHPSNNHSDTNSSDSRISTNGEDSGSTVAAAVSTGAVTVQYENAVIQELKQLCQQQRSRWGVLSGGILQVSAYSTVHLRFWSHQTSLKTNMSWAYVELRPLESSQQQQQQLGSQEQVVRVLRDASPQLPHRGARAGSSRAAATAGAAHQPQSRGNFTAAGNQQQQQQEDALPAGPLAGVAHWLLGFWQRSDRAAGR